MDVHSHTHTPRKKFTHYLWEFIMLFLAVFCGFQAENIREGSVEHHRERQYMQSLYGDIKLDTTEIDHSMQFTTLVMRYLDSSMYYLYNHPPVDYLPLQFSYIDSIALLRLKVIFNDETELQLKNSGNFRLIRNQESAHDIAQYWKQQENTAVSLERYLDYRNRGRQFAEKLFAFSEGYLAGLKLINPDDKGSRVIDARPASWAEYSNILAHCRVTAVSFLNNLEKQKTWALQVMNVLKKHYNVE